MSVKTFKMALSEEMDRHPEWGTYIAMCNVLTESGCSKTEIEKIFDTCMPKDEYMKSERKELVSYLIKIAKVIK